MASAAGMVLGRGPQSVSPGRLMQMTLTAACAGAAASTGRAGTRRAPRRSARRGRTARGYVDESAGPWQHPAQELPGPLLLGRDQHGRRRPLLEDPAAVEEADGGGDVAREA